MAAEKANAVFQRVEKKYLLTEQKYKDFCDRISPYMEIDQYGKHTICNIYYDTDTYWLIRNSIEKPKYKEKIRLRSYGVPNESSKVFLEIKKKSKGIVYKRRIQLTLKEAENYLERGIKPGEDSQIFREIDYFVKFYHPEKKLYLAYDRIAMFGKEDPEIRLTVDQNIRSRQYDLSLSKGDYGDKLMEENAYLLEIKVANAFPMWLATILSELEIYPSSFSKYGNIYKKSIIKEGVV
ncbi:polyphosphate polymerase domain-containing protein [Anaeromicropila populeti]|uniref:VTC domain-containing protein n=1 Tax=Anaeromicropila populeti TaxID=37658 RepID=A0A1I6KM06_9FIRM|nr:polyphosphate polymerase domain-containing protein [Anaeromicropila populeti]SFR91920.1 VTC domain-containing protein [Anaeromicropila populeti]